MRWMGLLLAFFVGTVQAIPSPDLVINLFASVGQLLGILSVAFGGVALKMRHKKRKGEGYSPWPLRISISLLVLSGIGFALYASHQIDLDNKRLRANLIRSSSEQGQKVGDVSLKTISFSDQVTHDRGITTDTLDQWLADDRPLNLIDVRAKEETEAGMIAGAVHQSYPSVLQDHSLAIEPGARTVFLCFSGNRSSELCDALAAQGVDCGFLVGGYEKWLAEERGIAAAERSGGELRALPYFRNKDVLLDTPKVEALVAQDDALFVDVRYPGDFELNHLPGAVNIPLRKLTPAESQAALETLPKDRPIVAPCYDKRSCFYGQILGLRLTRQGFDYRGRYSVPHEYLKPPSVRAHVAAWKSQQEGRSLLGMIGQPLHALLYELKSVTGSFVLAVALIVLILRFALLPFSVKSEVDNIREQRRKPQMQEMKRKLADHPHRLQRYMRRAAKEDRTTPLINLTGTLLQLLLFVVLFTVVSDAARDFGGGLWWMAPLSEPDPLFITPTLVSLLVLLHMFLSSRSRSKGRILLNFASAGLIFALTFSISAALNIYLVVSMGVLTLHGILVRGLFNLRERRATRADDIKVPSNLKGIIPLRYATAGDGSGNKAWKLGEMIRGGFRVPAGFALTHEILGQEELSRRNRKRLKKAWKQLGAEKVAVRSSGLNEDGSDKSYAGVFESRLEVTWDDFFPALEEVRQSLSSSRAASYSGQDESGGIVVQKMVPAEYAGVMFTEHPATSGSVLIEMVEGLGEALVSGQAQPKAFQFGRFTGQPLSEEAPPFDLTLLRGLGLAVERRMGRPQDIEWAYADGGFFLLQTRDITSDSRLGTGQKAIHERERLHLLELFQGLPKEQVVLEQDDLSSLLPTPTPLSLSLMERLWGAGGAVDLACGYLGIPYEVEEDSPPYAVSVFGALFVNRIEEKKRLGNGPGMVAAFRLSRGAEALEKEFRDDFLPAYLDEAAMREAVDFRRLPLQKLAHLFEEWSEKFITEIYYRAEVINVAAEYYLQTASRELERRGLSPADYLANVERTVVHQAMEVLSRVRHNEATIQQFLEIFGHRAPHDFELAAPRYSEDLNLVMEMAGRATQMSAEQAEAPPPLGSSVVDLSIARARRFQNLKEEAKHHCLRELAVLRRMLLEMDRQLNMDKTIFYLDMAEVCRLGDAGFREEAYNLARSKRDSAFKAQTDLPIRFTPASLETYGLDLDLPEQPAEGERALRGLRISGHGVGVGRARVLTDPEEIWQFQEGEVLVARFTDPSWTPVFSLAAGVITEVGGWLSHAAILARELDVVGIVGVRDATGNLKTGDLVRLHEDGTIEVIQRERRDGLRRLVNKDTRMDPKGAEHRVRLVEISRTGALLRCSHADRVLDTGTEIPLEILPDLEPVTARVVRQEAGEFAVAFDQPLAEQVIERLAGSGLEEQMEREQLAEDRLRSATIDVHQKGDLKSVLQEVLQSTTTLMQADRSSFFLYDSERGDLYSVVAEGMEGQEIRIPSYKGIAGNVFTNGELINIPDAYKDDRFNREVDKMTNYRTRSILCCPVESPNEGPIGVIQVLNKHQGSFDFDDERILREYAEQAAIAIENSREMLQQQIGDQSTVVDRSTATTKGSDA